MKGQKILLIEDEANIHEQLTKVLTAEGYSVEVATSLRQADQLMASMPDLLILDWMLPDGQGVDQLRVWRTRGVQVPVIILTARHDLVDKVLGLEFGADDYVTKPFEVRELLARIKARLRPRGGRDDAHEFLSHAGIVMDDTAHIVTFCGRPVELARMEYALLKLFLSNVNPVFSRDEILNRVWGFDAMPTTRTVDTHILILRQKLAPEFFSTVRGIGYRMPVQAAVQKLTES